MPALAPGWMSGALTSCLCDLLLKAPQGSGPVLTPHSGSYSARATPIATQPRLGPCVASFPVQLLPRDQRIILSGDLSIPFSFLLCLQLPRNKSQSAAGGKVKHRGKQGRDEEGAGCTAHSGLGRRAGLWRGQLCLHVAFLVLTYLAHRQARLYLASLLPAVLKH